MIQVLNPETHSPVGAIKLRGLAVRAIEAVSGPSSELASLWREEDSWRSSVARIAERLSRQKPKFGNETMARRPMRSRFSSTIFGCRVACSVCDRMT